MSNAPARSAVEYRADALALLAMVVHQVAPDADLVAAGVDDIPQDCTAPREGQVYYSLARTFTAASGTTGASLINALREQFIGHGFRVQQPVVSADATRVQGQTDTEGFMIRGDSTTGLVDIGFDTTCGAR